jgi:hypothetical protein
MNFNVTNPIQGDSEMSAEATAIPTEENTAALSVTDPVAEAKAEFKAEAPKRTKQELTAEEREPLHKAETAFLKAQIQINALQVQTAAAQKDFTAHVEALGKKYEIDPKSMQFDNANYMFVAVQKGQGAPIAVNAVKR